MTTTAPNTKRKIVLFIHGLESNPLGRKARILRTAFEEKNIVLVPELSVSFLDYKKENSFLRTWSVAKSLAGVVLRVHRYLKEQFRCILEQEGTVYSENSSSTFTIEEQELIRTRLIVVGSSFGGLTALKLCDQNFEEFQPCRMLLLAPALGSCGLFGFLMETWCPDRLYLDGERITCIQGDQDDTVPVQLLRDFKQRFPKTEYIEIEGGLHNLNDKFVDAGRMTGIVAGWLKEME
jgi:hypothetical protein